MLSKLNLKRKCIAILCSVATAAAILPAAPVPVFADATKVVSIGNDLTDAQKKTMMRYFGIENDKSVQQITVTNKDEISHLSSYIPLEQIGTRTVSCAYIKPTESGGIRVRTANLQYVTANMIASTLADLGIKNCEVVSACPFQVSGTGALTGIIMAYETATGETIDQAKKDIATQEVVVTKDLAKDIGNVQAEYVINQAKAEAVQNNISDKQEIQNTVTNIVNNNNINISQDQIENITNLTQNIVNEDYGDTYIENITEINNNIKQEIAASEDVDIDIDEDDDMTPIEEPVDTPPETPEVTESIMDNVDESVLGEDVIASSTDDPTLIIGTTVDTTENTGSDTDDETIAGIDDDPLFNVESEEANTTDGQDTEENTAETPAEPEEENLAEAPEPEIDETETEESGSTENVQLPENGLTVFGYDIAPVLTKTDEETAKKFIAAEDYMKEHFAFDETNADDMEAAAELKIGSDEEKDYKRDESGENISAVSKKILDAYYEFLMEDEHNKEFADIVMDKINEMIDAGWITEDAAVGLYDNVTDGILKPKPLAAKDVTEENASETEIPEQEEVVSTDEE
ncbi:DUF1002 domain-containing protein [Blautia glucerasea]|uniref:DUF1002 domain-containing protein n=1 Tax=Blautia TaxID=572511 RepID=UPI001570A004|nr:MULTISPECIES: DUF1002 domain-containing protein [Blautia]MCB5384924.1 DUF1002 domain-containing protein [Blautia glucerasea]NSJ71497.1 DUF1002 domain-containing protein [Blautia faecis]